MTPSTLTSKLILIVTAGRVASKSVIANIKRSKPNFDVARGNEPLVIVTVNGVSYSFIAEEISRNRVFGNYSYSISGRSITAQLGKDYAHSQGGTINQDLYASQIINMQLANLPFTIDRSRFADRALFRRYDSTRVTAMTGVREDEAHTVRSGKC